MKSMAGIEFSPPVLAAVVASAAATFPLHGLGGLAVVVVVALAVAHLAAAMSQQFKARVSAIFGGTCVVVAALVWVGTWRASQAPSAGVMGPATEASGPPAARKVVSHREVDSHRHELTFSDGTIACFDWDKGERKLPDGTVIPEQPGATLAGPCR